MLDKVQDDTVVQVPVGDLEIRHVELMGQGPRACFLECLRNLLGQTKSLGKKEPNTELEPGMKTP